MPHPSLPRRALLAAVAVPVVVGLGACAPSSKPQDQATAGSADPTKGLDQLTVGLNGSLSTLDVGQSGLLLNYYASALTEQGLVGIDSTGKLTPALATAWKQTDDTTWVYELRDDASFSDGTPVTTADVIFSINLDRDAKKSPSTAYYWPALTSVKATGAHEITIKLAQPSATFGWTPSAAAGLFVTSKKFYESSGTYGSAQKLVLGSGPYQVTEFAPDSHVTFERNLHYAGAAAKYKTVRFDFIADANTRLLAFQQGSVDIALGVPVGQSTTWSSTAGAQVKAVSDLSYQGITIEPDVAPFNDPDVRRAVAQAVDKQSIVTGILKDDASVATGITAPAQLAVGVGTDAASAAVGSLPKTEFDLDAAKADLEKSSKPDGFSTTLTYPDSDPNLGKVSLAIAESLKKIGVTVDVKEVPASTWSADIGNGKQGLSWMSYIPPVPTDWPSDWLLSADNPAGYTNKEMAALTAKAATAVDPQDRVDAVTQATSLALEDDIYVPVYWGDSITAFGSRVTPRDYSSYYFLTDWTAALDATS